MDMSRTMRGKRNWRGLSRKIPYPYIMKPADSLSFRENFAKKCFVIKSSQEPDVAVDRLRGKNLEVMIQEIIPGNKIYAAYLYFNKKIRTFGSLWL